MQKCLQCKRLITIHKEKTIFMKRVVLATITPTEAEVIESAERNYNTFLTLLQNIFISDEEKQTIVQHK